MRFWVCTWATLGRFCNFVKKRASHLPEARDYAEKRASHLPKLVIMLHMERVSQLLLVKLSWSPCLSWLCCTWSEWVSYCLWNCLGRLVYQGLLPPLSIAKAIVTFLFARINEVWQRLKWYLIESDYQVPLRTFSCDFYPWMMTSQNIQRFDEFRRMRKGHPGGVIDMKWDALSWICAWWSLFSCSYIRVCIRTSKYLQFHIPDPNEIRWK
jgi:hypothetical protein